jgi:hypothetical protein
MTTSLLADGIEYAIIKGTKAIDNKYGEKESVHDLSEIGITSVRVSENTLKTLTNAADGVLEFGFGYVTKNKNKKDIGLARINKAGRNTIVGLGKGLAYTVETGIKTTTSAVEAGKCYVQGNREQARQKFKTTKSYIKNMGKVLVVSSLTITTLDAVGIIGDDVSAAEFPDSTIDHGAYGL